jgi:hypothetical protein
LVDLLGTFASQQVPHLASPVVVVEERKEPKEMTAAVSDEDKKSVVDELLFGRKRQPEPEPQLQPQAAQIPQAVREQPIRVQDAPPPSKPSSQPAMLKRTLTNKLVESMRKLEKLNEKRPNKSGYLEKRRNRAPRLWKKKWLTIDKYTLVWCDRPVDLEKEAKEEEGLDEKQRKKLRKKRSSRKTLSLMLVDDVKAVAGKKGQGFPFNLYGKDPATSKQRHFEWRAQTAQERDEWIECLKKLKVHLAGELQVYAQESQLSV